MIHFRFVKDGKILGYGNVNNFSGWATYSTWTGPGTTKAAFACDLIERGIEVNGEVWYEGDIIEFLYYGLVPNTGTIKWENGHGMFVVWVEHKIRPYPLHLYQALGDTAKAKRIGNIHDEADNGRD